jgi:paraquat-inducible protein B
VSKKANPTVIGAFVVGAIILLVVTVVALGGGRFFRETTPVAMCFDESLKGLQVGAPILWEGVKVGEVTGIQLMVEPEQREFSAVVYGEIAEGTIKGLSGEQWGRRWSIRRSTANMQALVDEGMRAQLDVLSLVTGQLCIALSLKPNAPANLRGVDTGYFEIPTVPSLKDQVLSTLDQLPLKDISDSVISTARAVERLANDPALGEAAGAAKDGLVAMKDAAQSLREETKALGADLRQLVNDIDSQVKPVAEDLRGTMADTRRLINNLEGQVDPLASQVKDALATASDAITNADAALAHAAGAMSENSEVRVELGRALRDLAAAARSIEALADYLERHPEALLRGKGGD